VVPLAGVARTRSDNDQVEAVQAARLIVLPAHDLARHAEPAENVPEHVHEVVLAVEDHHALAGQPRIRRRAGLVVEPEAAEPPVA
jgi:hypothetical protein